MPIQRDPTHRPPKLRRAASAVFSAVVLPVVLPVVLLFTPGLIPAALANPHDRQGAYQQWEQMPAEQRERILQEQQRFKRLPPSEQERLRREYEQRRRQ